MSYRGMCAGHAVFFHTKVVCESKIAREMLCFTLETAVRLCEGTVGGVRRRLRIWSPVLGYRRIGPPLGSASGGR